VAGAHELVGVLAIERQTLGLHVRREGPALARPFVPLQPEPVQSVVDGLDGGGDEPLLVGVLDAQDQLSVLLAREEEVVERRAHAPDVQVTGRRGSETHTHICHGNKCICVHCSV
jgi:hypothetical protein